jgi:nucleotide-binding universal stress UspA family protein
MIPLRRILAATDFSPSADTALQFAARLARHTGAELHVMHAEDRVLQFAAQARGVDLIQEAHEALADTMARCAAGSRASRHVVVDLTAPAICDVAERERANLIVIGTKGMSGADRPLFGSTAEAVVRRTDVSVALVPPTWRPPPGTDDLAGTGPVVAAVEPSETALAAAAAAGQLARWLRTSLELLHVTARTPVLERWQPYAWEAAAARAKVAQHELVTMLRGVLGDCAERLKVDIGPVAERIVEATTETYTRHPLLVIGCRGRRIRCGVPGPTAYRVLALVRVPVLLYLPEIQ